MSYCYILLLPLCVYIGYTLAKIGHNDYLLEKFSLAFGRHEQKRPFWAKKIIEIGGRAYTHSRYLAYCSQLDVGWNYRIEEYFGRDGFALQVCWLSDHGFLVPIRIDEFFYSSHSNEWSFPGISEIQVCATQKALPKDYDGRTMLHRLSGECLECTDFRIDKLPPEMENKTNYLAYQCYKRYRDIVLREARDVEKDVTFPTS